MPIDPQSIASIGQNTADIGGAVQKAYTLSDAIDRTQMNKMTLASAQEEQANLGKLKSISSKFDLSTAEGQNSYAAKAMEIDPKLGMQVQKMMTETQRGALELDSAKLANYKEQNEAWGNILTPAADMIKQGIAAGKTPAEIQMSVMPLVQNGFKTLQAVKLSNGASPIPPEAAAQVTSLLSANDPNVFIKGIMDAANSSEVSRTKLAALEKERMGAANIKSEMDARKRTGENQASELDIRKRELALKERKDTELRAGGLSDEAVGSLSDQIVAGGKSRDVLANLGRGAQGATDIRKVQNEVARKMKENGMSANDILAKQQEVAGAAKEVQQAAIIASKVNYAEQEIMRLAPKVLELSAKVPRSSFVPLNKLLQMKDSAISDPDLKRFKAFNQTLLNAYDMLGARGGSDVGKREANHQALVTSDSAEAYEAAVGAIVQEGAISAEAGAESMKSPLRTPPAVSGTAPVPSPATGGTGAAGGTKLWEMKGGKLVLVQ